VGRNFSQPLVFAEGIKHTREWVIGFGYTFRKSINKK
jgi:hypothetical protein